MFLTCFLFAGFAGSFFAGCSDDATITGPGGIGLRGTSGTLTVCGKQFCVGGEPTFLLGISYYGALSASPETLRKDLDDMLGYGFNWFRVWAIWDAIDNVSAMSANGAIREPYLSNLKHVISEADRRGMIADVTLMRGDGAFPSTFGDHLACVATLATELKPYRNVYFDVANECNLKIAGRNTYVSPREVGDLITTIKSIDPDRLCTASESHIVPQELHEYLTLGSIDFIAPHMGNRSFDAILSFQSVLSNIKAYGFPIHMQEPFRNGYENESYAAQDFLHDYEGTKLAGGAGWCFHNGSRRSAGMFFPPHKGFWVAEQRLFEQLDNEEIKAIQHFQ